MEPSYHEHELSSEQESVFRQLNQLKEAGSDSEAAFLKLKLIKSGLESEYKSLCTSIRDAEEQLEHNQSCLAAADESLVLLAQESKDMEAEAKAMARSIAAISASIDAVKACVKRRKSELNTAEQVSAARLRREKDYVTAQAQSVMTDAEFNAQKLATRNAVLSALSDMDAAILEAQARLAAIRERRGRSDAHGVMSAEEVQLFESERPTADLEAALFETRLHTP